MKIMLWIMKAKNKDIVKFEELKNGFRSLKKGDKVIVRCKVAGHLFLKETIEGFIWGVNTSSPQYIMIYAPSNRRSDTRIVFREDISYVLINN